MELEGLSSSLRNIMKESSNILNKRKNELWSVEVKSKNSLVTEIDKELERYFVSELEKLIPESGFIAEEGTSNKKGEDYNWIIDPLDGTTNFIHGIPAFCASIALMKGSEIVLGGILEFNSGEYFEAAKGQGAFLNGQEIHVSKTESLENSLLATGFPYYDYEHTENYLILLKELMNESRGIRRIGSAALDMAYVSCGRFDGFFEYSLHPWDVAAGIILIKEAGGQVSDLIGGQNHLYGKQMLACNNGIYDEMLKKTKKYFT